MILFNSVNDLIEYYFSFRDEIGVRRNRLSHINPSIIFIYDYMSTFSYRDMKNKLPLRDVRIKKLGIFYFPHDLPKLGHLTKEVDYSSPDDFIFFKQFFEMGYLGIFYIVYEDGVVYPFTYSVKIEEIDMIKDRLVELAANNEWRNFYENGGEIPKLIDIY